MNLNHCKYAGRIIQHWCNKDLKYSELIAKLLLEALKDRDIPDMQGLFNVIVMFLTVNDLYVQHRIEWVLGITAFCKDFTSETSQLYLTGACILCIDEGLHSYPSGLGFNSLNSREGIIRLIWKSRKTQEPVSLSTLDNC